MNSPLSSAALFHVGPVPVTEAVAATWGIMLVLVIGASIISRHLSLVPSKTQAFFELISGTVDSQIRDTMREEPAPYRAFIGTLFTFIFVANWSSLVPGVEPPTAHIETDAALALLVFAAVIWFGIRASGVWGYLGTFASPNPIMIPLNFVESLTRTFSLLVRLFGNVMSGVFVIGIVLSLAGLLVPIPLMALDLLTGAVQAYIFAVLAMVFIAGAIGEAHSSTSRVATLVPESPSDGFSQGGLTSEEARRRLETFGPNTMPDTALHPLRLALEKFWAPVPWMLEAAILLELVLGKYTEAAIITGLLIFNAALGLLQESRAQATLAALKSRLAVHASVLRDGAWKTLPAAEIVLGDMVKLSLGGVAPADMRITSGEVLLDQSMLTGESMPIEAGPDQRAYAGALIRRGEAEGEVTATGTRTKFGRVAELVRTARIVSSQQKAVLSVVRNLAAFNGAVIMLLVACAWQLNMPLDEIIPLVLTAVLASIPVALPATFTLASAIGGMALARQGVLLTRLSAADEAASMDVLCSDKTGTLTRNTLTITAVRPMTGFDEEHVLALAALASSNGGQDPIDAAIRAAGRGKSTGGMPRLVKFVPFDPATKLSEAMAADPAGGIQHIVKGAFSAIAALLTPGCLAATGMAAELEEQGFRVLGVAGGRPDEIKLAGLIALSDPPRTDAAALIAELHELHVRTVMVTGDAPVTAAIVAHAVGLDGAVCAGPIPESVLPEQFAVFAGVLPEEKYKLVKSFQKSGHIVGMCGDGANDAPALRQAQIGIAVSTATDVAKSAAGMVLTEPGLAGIVAAVKEGRVIFQRILTYTLNSIIKKIVTVLFLFAGLIMTGQAILTPLLMVIVMIAGDLLAMSLTTDNIQPSPAPNTWRIRTMTMAATIMAICQLAFCCGILAAGKFEMGMGISSLRTLAFVTLVFGSQATLYVIRKHEGLSGSGPSLWLALSSLADILIASALAARGIAMAPLPVSTLAGLLAAVIPFAVALDLVKSAVFVLLKFD